MRLISFHKDKNNYPKERDSKPFVTVNKRGKFNLSQGARRLLSLKQGDRIVIHQDSESRFDWYFQITNQEIGYKIVMSKTDSRFTCKAAAIEIFKVAAKKDDLKLSLPIITNPFINDGIFFYRIDLKNTLK